MSRPKRRLAAASVASLVLASASLLVHCDVEGVTPDCTTDSSRCITPPGVSEPGTGGAGGSAGAGGDAGEGGSGGTGGTNAGGAGGGGRGGSAGSSGAAGSGGASGSGGTAGSPDAGLRDSGASDADLGDAVNDRRTDSEVGISVEAGSPLDARLDAPDGGEP